MDARLIAIECNSCLFDRQIEGYSGGLELPPIELGDFKAVFKFVNSCYLTQMPPDPYPFHSLYNFTFPNQVSLGWRSMESGQDGSLLAPRQLLIRYQAQVQVGWERGTYERWFPRIETFTVIDSLDPIYKDDSDPMSVVITKIPDLPGVGVAA